MIESMINKAMFTGKPFNIFIKELDKGMVKKEDIYQKILTSGLLETDYILDPLVCELVTWDSTYSYSDCISVYRAGIAHERELKERIIERTDIPERALFDSSLLVEKFPIEVLNNGKPLKDNKLAYSTPFVLTINKNVYERMLEKTNQISKLLETLPIDVEGRLYGYPYIGSLTSNQACRGNRINPTEGVRKIVEEIATIYKEDDCFHGRSRLRIESAKSNRVFFNGHSIVNFANTYLI